MIESNKLYDVIIENDGEDGLDTNEVSRIIVKKMYSLYKKIINLLIT